MTDRKKLILKWRIDSSPLAGLLDFEVGLFRPEDALGVARLVYEHYGELHPFDYVYNPDEIARLFSSGQQYAVVARSVNGVVLGMIGMYRCAPHPRIFELAQLMVLNSQRGRGIASLLWRRAMNELPEVIGAVSIFGEAVCTHAFSQKMCQETGMLFCGLVVDSIPARAYVSDRFQGERTSLILCSKILKDTHHHVYLPACYHAPYKTYCEHFNIKRNIVLSAPCALPSVTVFELIEFQVAHSIKVLIHSIGHDLSQILCDCENKTGGEGIVQVVFNLGDKNSIQGVETLRRYGYYLGGFLPLWFNSDGILMQKRKDKPSFSKIKTFNHGAFQAKRMVQEDYDALQISQTQP